MGDTCCEHCTHTQEDHDAIVRIETLLKTDFARSQDHESRLRKLEKLGAWFVGGLFIVNVALSLYVGLHK